MSHLVQSTIVPILYLLSAVLFIAGLMGMTRIRSARRGNAIGAVAMLLAIIATLLKLGLVDYRWIIVGVIVGSILGALLALKVPMTAMPEMVALLNGCGGGASALVATSVLWVEVIELGKMGKLSAIQGPEVALTTFLSILIGGVTFSGSMVAYLKLQGKISGQPILLPARNVVNFLIVGGSVALGLYFAFGANTPHALALLCIVLLGVSLVLGVLLVIPIGGADMPVVISLLNSYSGLAAAMTGFVLGNSLLIISGALVGASGIILSKIMCDAMNRTLGNVLFGGFGTQAPSAGKGGEYTNVRSYTAEDAALVLEAAESVVIVPGYGLAVAQAQHTAEELAELLEKRGCKVTYGIHPVAGRMPGHMNVLLAEANVPYEKLLEMDTVNSEFKNTDVVLVVGANDVVNPAAETTPGSPIYGMPVLQVWNAQTVMVIKRSLSPGFAGIKNDLFENDNTMMIFGDAKKVLHDLVTEVKSLSPAA
ncbi:MAG TPA: NAD(P)(+) transhydrogenase (Re/Si-specific) subunit beta [Thermoanaerobaculia bacterium]|nr:NAD(P)(+) transhydrogenase (Re/Si-specific) subunit beta [Thermoanaerobaculia bacterium]